MTTHDWGWYQKTFEFLFGFMYIHYVNTLLKPDSLREHPWDWYLDEFHGPIYATFGAYNLVAGYAIETIIKCCLDNAGWEEKYENHNLSELAQHLASKWGFQLEQSMLDELNDFQEYIVWKGKYPTPKAGKSAGVNGLQMGQHIYDKLRRNWSFFFHELRKRDQVLADVYLTIFMHDSKNIHYENMEMFDTVADIAKKKLLTTGMLLQVSETKNLGTS